MISSPIRITLGTKSITGLFLATFCSVRLAGGIALLIGAIGLLIRIICLLVCGLIIWAIICQISHCLAILRILRTCRRPGIGTVLSLICFNKLSCKLKGIMVHISVCLRLVCQFSIGFLWCTTCRIGTCRVKTSQLILCCCDNFFGLI